MHAENHLNLHVQIAEIMLCSLPSRYSGARPRRLQVCKVSKFGRETAKYEETAVPCFRAGKVPGIAQGELQYVRAEVNAFIWMMPSLPL